MPTADIDDTQLHYEIDGEGPPWLVLHGGLGLDHHLYRASLGPLASGRHVVFYDHRGNGRSGRPPLATLTIEQLAADAVALADHLGFDRFSVLGHSYGGFIAQELAIGHADRVERLVLVATTPGQPGDGEDVSRYAGPPPPPELTDAIAAPPATDADYAELTTRLLPFYFHRTDPADVAPMVEGTVFDAAAMARGFEVLASWSSVDRLGAITCPVLLVSGRHDRFCAHPQSQRIADHLRDATVVLLDHSGHFPWIEEPDAFFAALDRWSET